VSQHLDIHLHIEKEIKGQEVLLHHQKNNLSIKAKNRDRTQRGAKTNYLGF